MMPDPWDRLTDESQASYARFLAYRNLGPGRSLRHAYAAYRGAPKGTEGHQAPGRWKRESAAFRWGERAAAWDARQLRACGADLAALWVGVLTAAARRAAETLADPDCRPVTFREVLAVLDTLAPYITPDVLRGLWPGAGGPADGPLVIDAEHTRGV